VDGRGHRGRAAHPAVALPGHPGRAGRCRRAGGGGRRRRPDRGRDRLGGPGSGFFLSPPAGAPAPSSPAGPSTSPPADPTGVPFPLGGGKRTPEGQGARRWDRRGTGGPAILSPRSCRRCGGTARTSGATSSAQDTSQKPRLGQRPRSRFPAMAKTDWNTVLRAELDAPYFKELQRFVAAERARQRVYPPPAEVFAALHLTPYASVKV